MFEENIKKKTSLDEKLKLAMRDTCNMVYVVSTGSNITTRNAITITSFTVVSLEPPSILFCINKSSRFAGNILDEGVFCINIMPEHLENIATVCSAHDVNAKFKFSEWIYMEGLPYLPSAIANLICDKNEVMDSGTHIIVKGMITKILSSGKQLPLLYHDRKYKTIKNLTDI